MARDWRRLVLAALAVAALTTASGVMAVAQTRSKAAAKKAPGQQAKPSDNDEPAEEAQAKAASAKKKKQDPAEAQRAIDAALKLLDAGKPDQAVTSLSATLSAGGLPPPLMAKALLYRGTAYRQQNKPAQAISDLTSALWLKGGLSQADRADALRQRAAAYQEAGLSETGEGAVAAAPGSSSTPRGGRNTGSTGIIGWGDGTTTSLQPATPAQSPPAQSQGSGWNLFGNLFGGGSSASQNASASPPPPTTASVPEPPDAPADNRPRIASAWVQNTEVRSAARAERSPPSQRSESAPAAKPEGKFRIQLASVRTQQEAVALAEKVKREYGAVLAAREPEVDQGVVGNMGSFYRVRVGPFASQQEVQAVCARLKGSGLDCLVVTQ